MRNFSALAFLQRLLSPRKHWVCVTRLDNQHFLDAKQKEISSKNMESFGSEKKKLRRLSIFCETQLCRSCNFALCMLCIIFSKLAKDFKELNLVLEG